MSAWRVGVRVGGTGEVQERRGQRRGAIWVDWVVCVWWAGSLGEWVGARGIRVSGWDCRWLFFFL